MNRIISNFLNFVLKVKQIFKHRKLPTSSQVSQSSNSIPDSNNIELSIITPPVICKPALFPIIAAITNTNLNGSIILNKAKWRCGNHKFRYALGEEIEARGDSLLNLDQLRSKKNSLTDAERETLSNNYERLKKSTMYLRFKVNEDMAKEILSKGSLELSLKLRGKSLIDKKSIRVCKKVTIHSGRTPQSPRVVPGAPHGNWYFGDTHSHSTRSWDYYFGNGIYTIPELKSLAIVAGLDWLVLTDHAYCLDSKKFDDAKNVVTKLSEKTFAFLYGEELSCAELVNNKKAYNSCHCNGIMNNTFVPCKTDLFREASSPDSQQGINYLKQYGGLVTINHANYGTGLFESWNFDINTYPYTHGETGMEVMNGKWSDLNNGSTTRWVDRRLLNGERVFPFAGSDTESANHLGECYTVVYADCLTQTNIKNNLEKGHQYVTTYPGLAIWAKQAGTSIWSFMGDTLTMGSGTAEINLSYADSTDGLNIFIMKGKTGWTSEQLEFTTKVSAGSSSITVNIAVESGCYLRAYCTEVNDNNQRAYTTPIWFD